MHRTIEALYKDGRIISNFENLKEDRLLEPPTEWLHYGDQQLAPLRRSPTGPITAITKWLYSTDK